MKRNNKALYEQIMKNVSREVKRSLNEARYNSYSQENAIIKLMNFAHVDRINMTKGTVQLHSYMPPSYVSITNGNLKVGDLFHVYNNAKFNDEDWENLFFGVRDCLYDEIFSDTLSKEEYDEFADWIYNKAR